MKIRNPHARELRTGKFLPKKIPKKNKKLPRKKKHKKSPDKLESGTFLFPDSTL